MIFTSAKQLKDWVGNLSKKTGVPSNTLMQTYLMERFVERISASAYRSNLVLKGGFLIAAMIGADKRSTMDIDTTLKGMPASKTQVQEMIEGIISIDLGDGASFSIVSIKPIHEEHAYDDFRLSLDISLFTIRGNLKVDITVGDSIVPGEIAYDYPLLFEDKTIPVMAYSLYTILAEKIETILSRNVTNTRGRDFYDVYMLLTLHQGRISKQILHQSLQAKAMERNSLQHLENYSQLLHDIESSPEIRWMWAQYTSRYTYANDIQLKSVISLINRHLSS